jgi:hypothetical protein
MEFESLPSTAHIGGSSGSDSSSRGRYVPLTPQALPISQPSSSGDDDSGSGVTKLAFRIGQILLVIVSLIFFFFGASNKANIIVQTDGYNEVFLVLGCLFLGPVIYTLYELATKFCAPTMKPSTELKLWTWGIRVAITLSFLAQAACLMVYLYAYVGQECLAFLVADIILLAIMLLRMSWTSLWTTIYVLIFAVKIGIFWPNLDPSATDNHSSTTPAPSGNHFLSIYNDLGENGWLATLFITIPIIHFPVHLSRLPTAGSIPEAFMSNMGAVFAHMLHYLDTLELYFLGVKRTGLPVDVQYLILMFSLMGCVTCNVYFISLFYQDDTVEKTLKRFQPSVVGVFSAEEGVKNEDLLHFFLWMLFFIDLPYAALRGIIWIVHGTDLSVFFAKNLMMMASVATLIIQHSRH